MPIPRNLRNWFWTVAGTLGGATLLWLSALVWASKADAAQVAAVDARVTTLTELQKAIVERLDRIENKLDAILHR